MGALTSAPQQEGTVGSNEAGSSSQVGESDETRGADTTPLNVPPAEPQSPIKDVAITIEEIPTEETIEEAPAEQLENNEDQEAESSGTEGGLTPDDATLLAAVKSFQAQNPSMGLAKVRQALKAYYGWELSKKRLKTCIPPTLPPDPLQVRLTYKDVVLYGYGKYNFGLTPITPNPDEGTVLDVYVHTIDQFLEREEIRPLSYSHKWTLAHTPEVQHLWSYYKAGAKIAGIRLEHVLRQFEAEYETDPRMTEDKDAAKAEAATRAKAEEYKIEKIKILREQAKVDPESVTLDSNGDPVYDEEKHGQYAVTVKKLDQNGVTVATIE